MNTTHWYKTHVSPSIGAIDYITSFTLSYKNLTIINKGKDKEK